MPSRGQRCFESKAWDGAAPATTAAARWARYQHDYYERNLEDYERLRALRTRAYARKARILHRAIETPGRCDVLEVGAGSGLVTAFLAPALPRASYVALDFSTAMLAAARARMPASHARFVVTDARSAGLAGEQFNAIVGVDILHHLEAPSDAMREWLRLARPGAKLAILETNPYHPVNLQFIGIEHELRLFLNSPANLVRWAREAGWDEVTLAATPTFTPSGPQWLGRALDAVDSLAFHLPGARLLAALWLLTGRKPVTSGAAGSR
jgi:ubiquinone/menaquinone biosynthesis C-methylase UbiE